MNVPKVSIVMAVYNGQPYLAETITSVLNQTFNDFEFIIVDDGSTDNTWKILNTFAEQDSRLVLLRNQPNQGVVRALNAGLNSSKGDFIVRQDADDISLPERLARQVEFLRTHPDHGCVGVAVQKVDSNGLLLGIGYQTQDNESIQQELLDNMCICGPTVMVCRECFETIGFFFSEGLNASEDYDLCLRLAEVTKLAVIKDPLYLYRQHPQSASRTQEQRQAFNKAVALERAIFRRYGMNASMDKFAFVGRDYLRAAIIAACRKDLPRAHESLEQARKVYPPILDTEQPLGELIRAYTPLGSVDDALEYTKIVFKNLLPQTRRLRCLEARILSELHMSAIFNKENSSDLRKKHLWAGIYYNPAWLLNRGVVSTILHTVLNRKSSASTS